MDVLSNWLEDVRRRLKAAGVGIDRRERLLVELREHGEDCLREWQGDDWQRSAAMTTKEGTATVADRLSARLGTPEAVAETAVRHGAPEPFARRYRWLLLVLAPLPLYWLGAVLYVLALGGMRWCYLGDAPGAQTPSVFVAGLYGLAYVPSALVVAVLAVLAARSRLGIGWWLAASAIPVLIASRLVVMVELSDLPGKSSMLLGADLSPHLVARHFMQALVPLAIGGLAYVVATRRQGRYHTA